MSMFNKIKVLKNRNVIIYIISFLAAFVGVGLNFFLARVLEAEQYGEVQYLVALATTISQFLIFGLNMFLIREAKNEKQNGEIVNKCFSFYLSVVLFAIPIIFYVLNNSIPVTKGNILISSSVIVVAVLMGLTSLISAYHQGSGKYHLSVIFENLFPKLFLLIAAIIFLIIGRLGFFQSNYLLFYFIFYSVTAIPFTIKLFKGINLNFKKSEVVSIFFFFGVTVTYSLGNNLTKVLQGGLYQNNAALGIISVSISVISLIKVFTAVLDNLIKPIFAKKKRENNISGLLDTYRFETRINMYVAIPLYVFFVIFPSKFLQLFGQSYLLYPKILAIIAAANAFNDITGSNGTLLAMTGHEKWELFNGILYFASYFASIFIFSSDKIYGLSFALLISQIIVNIAKYIETWCIYKKNPLNLRTILTLLIIVASNILIIFAFSNLNISSWVWYPLAILIGILLLCANFFLISLYRKTDFKQLLSLKL